MPIALFSCFLAYLGSWLPFPAKGEGQVIHLGCNGVSEPSMEGMPGADNQSQSFLSQILISENYY